MSVLAPLSDITNLRRVQSNIAAGQSAACQALSPLMSRSSCESTGLSPEVFSPLSVARESSMSYSTHSAPTPAPANSYRHDPYNWKCLPENDIQATLLLAQRAHIHTQRMRRTPTPHVVPQEQPRPMPAVEPVPELLPNLSAAQAPSICRTLVQFKCHQAEYSSPINLEKGQYVVVQGDRGMDIGVVIRVNTDASKTFIERTGPCGHVMRHATQREVDYWASELKADEAVALDFCRRRVVQHDLPMEVKYAEYQFDKKKLTFYYDAKTRVDFVTLLKELYREYGCRIWMEKVRQNE